MFDPKQLAYAFVMWGVILIAGDQAARSSERISPDLYPYCTPIITEIDRAWHEGQITERQAHRLIRNCLSWEDRQ